MPAAPPFVGGMAVSGHAHPVPCPLGDGAGGLVRRDARPAPQGDPLRSAAPWGLWPGTLESPYAPHYPTYLFYIAAALRSGHRVDVDRGLIYGIRGRPMVVNLKGRASYPRVTLQTRGMPKAFYVVELHKVIAYARWGPAAFAPGVQVRHLNGDVLDCSWGNLALGTAHENQMDKPPEVRSRVFRAYRAAMGVRGPTTTVSDAQARWLQQVVERTPSGRARYGQLREHAERFGVSRQAIWRALTAKLGPGLASPDIPPSRPRRRSGRAPSGAAHQGRSASVAAPAGATAPK